MQVIMYRLKELVTDMKQINVYNKENVLGWSARFNTDEESDSWLNKHISKNTFGQPERTVCVKPEETVYDEDGNFVETIFAQYEVVPAEYTIEILDLTEQIAQENLAKQQQQAIYAAAAARLTTVADEIQGATTIAGLKAVLIPFVNDISLILQK